ncbi:uncharacterized protein BCR38DRAFT_343491 [Pseudomassariella vexata]|uniref:Uncharacterized protein n=1 Tax=Pseudomassariella vexata TaxID=1141098 RepID=A0A1Y2DY39_9PEZI|nr:uncharacterized protein BCR38DRAFT_343491 [Pseudomassariella vexata]ORY64163.1 hypothetical protein BCR38DRAFT_343491 [Pseudomassariella vexata]
MKLHAKLFSVASLATWLINTVTVLANTEKAIFLGAQTINMPTTHPNLDDLHIDTLTPENWTIRTHLEAQFPTESAQYGKATWLVLDRLTAGQRYEVRVCWAATQPTEFRLKTYELPAVFETPELITSLSEYSWSRQAYGQADETGSSATFKATSGALHKEKMASVLLLQILAAADYYTTNTTLMSKVPPVFVDIILDPFILNIFPRSLLPTVGYIIVVAVLSYFLARQISIWIRHTAQERDQAKKRQ